MLRAGQLSVSAETAAGVHRAAYADAEISLGEAT